MEVTKDRNAFALLIDEPHMIFKKIDLRMHYSIGVAPSSIEIHTRERTSGITDHDTIGVYHWYKLYYMVR